MSVDSDQMPQKAASDQGLHCLRTGISNKNTIKNEKLHQIPLKWQMDLEANI